MRYFNIKTGCLGISTFKYVVACTGGVCVIAARDRAENVYDSHMKMEEDGWRPITKIIQGKTSSLVEAIEYMKDTVIKYSRMVGTAEIRRLFDLEPQGDIAYVDFHLTNGTEDYQGNLVTCLRNELITIEFPIECSNVDYTNGGSVTVTNAKGTRSATFKLTHTRGERDATDTQ